MIRLRHKILIQAFRIFDQVVLVGVFLLLVGFIEGKGNFIFIEEVLEKSYELRHALSIAAVLLGWYVVFGRIVRYDANRFTPLTSQIWDIIRATTITTLLLLAADAVFGINMITIRVVPLFWACSTAILIASRIVLRSALKSMRRSGLNCRHILIIGVNQVALDMASRIESRSELGYEIVGFLKEEGQDEAVHEKIAGRWEIQGGLAEVKPYLERGVVDEVMVCLPMKVEFEAIYEIVELCRDLGVVVRVVPDLLDVRALTHSQVELFDGDYVVTFFRENLLAQLLAKRFMDFVGSGLLLILLSPLLLLTALLIKVTSPGPVFFAQERLGMNKRKFKLLKFRSMVVDAEAKKKELEHMNEMDGPVFKIKNDPRVTKVGGIIRKLSIDELPQLINVVKGEMSLVGPRPPLPSEVDLYDWTDRKRLSIKPGITCIWQVSGRNEISFEEWMELDRKYIENWSLWLDIRILLKTIPVVLLGRGAS